MLSNCGVGEDSWESLGQQGDQTSLSLRKSTLNIRSGFIQGSERLMLKLKLQYFGHLMQRVDSLEKTLMRKGFGAGGEGDDRGWDGWMASLTWGMWVWVNSGSWWWTGRPGVLLFMGSQRVRHNWATELNWTDALIMKYQKNKFKNPSYNCIRKKEIPGNKFNWGERPVLLKL